MSVDRLDAARGRVRNVRAELRSPAAEFPCINCRYYELACTHPAVSKISVSPISGKAKVVHLSGEEARSETGACGPEGALFDSRSLPGLIVVSALSHPVGRWVLGFTALILFAGIFGY
jgi:hypothetical protein